MAKKNKVNSSKGVSFNGKTVSPRLLQKRLDRLERLNNKNQSRFCMPSANFADQKALSNLKYLDDTYVR
jgi:hypothetical protein